MRKKLTWGAVLLFLVSIGVIGVDKYLKYCQNNPNDSACAITPEPSPSPTVAPTPSPSPTVVPTPSPTPTITPTPVPTCEVPSSNDPNWTVQGPQPLSEKQAVTLQATQNIGDRCGTNPDESLILLARELNRLGECADKWADSVLIRRTATYNGKVTWEQRHAVGYGDGCWRTGDGPNIYEGTWIYEGLEISLCPNPRPLFEFEDGSPHYRIDSKDYGADQVDVTVTYLDRWDPESATCPYCTAIGMGTIGGQARCTCPTRPPGHPDEIACNDYLTGGKLVLQSRNGAVCIPTADTKFVKNNGNCRYCSNDGRVCSVWS